MEFSLLANLILVRSHECTLNFFVGLSVLSLHVQSDCTSAAVERYGTESGMLATEITQSMGYQNHDRPVCGALEAVCVLYGSVWIVKMECHHQLHNIRVRLNDVLCTNYIPDNADYRVVLVSVIRLPHVNVLTLGSTFHEGDGFSRILICVGSEFIHNHVKKY